MLKYTGHPLIDAGVATIAAFVHKPDVAAINAVDLRKIADYIADVYPTAPFRSYLTMAFTSNGWFIQDQFNPDKDGLTAQQRKKRQEKRAEVASAHLLQWQEVDADLSMETCVFFTGTPVAALPLSDELPPGHAGRNQIPLLLGDKSINFYPSGEKGLPVSGLALLCFQAFPLGSARCGKPLVVHSDNPDLMYEFARRFLEANRRAINLARDSHATEMSKASSPAKTLLIKTFIDIESERLGEQAEHHASSVTAYHLSNSGQGPSLEIYHLPLELTRFLGAIVSAEYRSEWQIIEHRAWRHLQKQEETPEEIRPKKRKPKKAATDNAEEMVFSRNTLYEDLFDLPGKARYFVRRYFLGKSLDSASWKLSELLMKEVMHMDKSLLNEIKQLGDKLGQYIQETGDKQFYSSFFAENRYDFFRDLLMRVNRRRLKAAQAPIITLDEFYSVFELEIEGVPRYDRWKLARDLVLIRMTEVLYKAGSLKELADAIPEIEEPKEEQE